MGKEIITFVYFGIDKRRWHHRKNLILLEYVDIDNIKASSMVSSGETIKNILLVSKIIIIKFNYYA